METPLLRYKLSGSVDFVTKVFAVMIMAGGVWLFWGHAVAGVVVVLIGMQPLVYQKSLEIDLYKGTYCVGITLFGYTLGRREPYPGVRCIFIKRNRYIQRHSRRSWRPIATTSFDSFLWLDDDTKILLSHDGTLENALQRNQPLADELQTSIKDLTAPFPQR